METTAISTAAPTAGNEQDVLQLATQMSTRCPDWVTYFREVLGLNGIVRRAYPSPEALAAFEQTEAYQQIQQMLAEMRNRGDQESDDKEPTRVITVRLPKSLHESLRTEAHERKTSMNKLCISKLLQMIQQELVPSDGIVGRR